MWHVPLPELVSQLEAAVRVGDRPRAIELARQIEQRLVREHFEEAAIEQRVRALMAELEQPGFGVSPLESVPLIGERGTSEPESAGVVFPVSFGTNRKPHPHQRFHGRSP